MADGSMVFLLLSFLAVSVSSLEVCTKLDDCSCKKSNGKIISLRNIDGKSGPKFTGIKQKSKPFTFSWNPCTKFSIPSHCNDVLLCQRGSGDLDYPVAKTADSFTIIEGNIVLVYEEVTGSDKKQRKGVITLKCDESKYPGNFSEFTETGISSPFQYAATFTSKCACDDGCPNVPGGKGSQRLSTGSILLIVFIPLIFVYFIAGMLYNKYHKGTDTFPEMIPNHSFWSDFPFLIKDGCVFTFEGITGCCVSLCMRLKGDSYAKI
ncbi:unnamed protein product [Porites evermanni]|uniref:MRH domain-containing protein n=1 Tax=Porites evermanni TaxID=104178 RepID=A0ABN8MWP8_9CNID|nr:unnamed protein product [Porites evermanni]